jgi:predicted CoA-binding protein
MSLTGEQISAISRFPDQNPNPVLRVTTDGALLSANPASSPIVAEWSMAVGSLVPAEPLAELRDAAASGGRVEVRCGHRTFELLAVDVAGFGFIAGVTDGPWRTGSRGTPFGLWPHGSQPPEVAMATVDEAASEFLSHKRIAVAGVSRHPQGHGANIVYQRLRERGYEVFAVNPNADIVEGDRCYHDLASIPGGVDGVVIGTTPAAAEGVVRDCAALGITRVWMHRGFGGGSVSAAAADDARRHGVTVIDGACPLMYGPTADLGHRGMCWILNLMGRIPKQV